MPRVVHRRLWIAIAGVVAALACGAAYLHWDSPLSRSWLEHALAQSYHGQVRIQTFHSSLFPRPAIRGTGLVLQSRGSSAPLATVAEFHASADWRHLLFGSRHLGNIALRGLVVNVAPASQSGPAAPLGAGASPVATSKRPAPPPTVLVLESMKITQAAFNIYPVHGGPPQRFAVAEVSLRALSASAGMAFQAKLAIPKPAGTIRSQGTLGPWNSNDPAATPLTGSYDFSNVDLASLGLAGTLRSQGRFAGRLDGIRIQAQAEAPRFALDPGANGTPLHTDLQARFDATSGSLTLDKITATLGRSPVTAEGAMSSGQPLTLRVAAGHAGQPAQLADFMGVASPAGAPLAGELFARVGLILKAGTSNSLQRLHISGAFQLNQARFLDPDTQQRIAGLSQRGQGHPTIAAADPPPVRFNMRGDFTLARGVAHIAKLAFAVPGATVHLDGSYDLASDNLSFHGTVTTQAKVSQMTSGIKSLLLHALDPFFKSPSHGAVIPISISGTRQHPQFHLDLLP
ncbi:MAG: AsmA family protein [Terriglobales bacterium]